ncbi:MAG: RbsD/FucU domain-containing protein [Christensenellales bacterium]
MEVVPGKFAQTPPIWAEYRRILDESGEPYNDFEYMERMAFYERAKHAYANWPPAKLRCLPTSS